MEFAKFFEVFIKPRSTGMLHKDGIEFRYTAASILIACAKSDMDRDPQEENVIRQILKDAFEIPDGVIDRLIEVGE